MEFKRLYLRNFLSVGSEPTEILFNSKSGLTVIRGNNFDVSDKSSNGAGKSTIIEGILFGLYGKTLRKLKKEESHINQKNKEGCLVEIEFDNVKIVRKLKCREGKKLENGVEFWLDGKRQSTNASITEVKKDIEKHLAINFETMCNILIFGQHNMVSFLDAGEPEKREIVENLMNLKEYNEFEERAKTKARELRVNIKVLSESHAVRVQHLGEHINLKFKQEQALKVYRENLDNEIKELEQQLSSIPNVEFIRAEWERYNSSEEQKRKIEQDGKALTEQKNKVLDEINAILAQKTQEAEQKKPLLDHYTNLAGKKALIDKRKQDNEAQYITPLYTEQRELLKQMTVVDAEQTSLLAQVQARENWDALLSSAAKNIAELEKSVKALEGKSLNHNEICPECFGKIDINNCANVLKSRKAELESAKNAKSDILAQKKADEQDIAARKQEIELAFADKLKDLRDKFEELANRTTALQNEIEADYKDATKKLDSLLKDAKDKIAAFDGKVEEKFKPLLASREKERDDLQIKIGQLRREFFLVSNAQKPSVTLEEVATMTAEAEGNRKLLAQKKKARKENPYKEIIASLTEQIDKTDKEAKEIEAQIKESEKKLPYYDFWVTAFGKEGIKSFVIDQIVPTLNQQIEYWMQIIYQGAISVKFDKYLNVTMINNASKNEMIFGQGSGGERRRIDIAIMLAFREVMQLSTGKNPNVVFFDEVAENLDEDGVYRLHATLDDIAKRSRVFVITHNPTLLTLLAAADKLTVQKKNGEMTLVDK